MKLLTIVNSLALCISMAASVGTHAQDPLAPARKEFIAFWDFSAANISQPSQRSLIQQRAKELVPELDKVLSGGIPELLNQSSAMSDQELSRKLDEVLTPPSVDRVVESLASAVSTNHGQHRYVAFAVTTCATCSSIWFGDFAREGGGRYHLAVSKTGVLIDTNVSLTLLAAGGQRKLLLLSGTHFGDSHNRLDVKGFATDSLLTSVWVKSGLPRGELSIRNSHVVISFGSLNNLQSGRTSEEYELRENSLHLLRSRDYED